jgi:hypothetical protein
MSDVPVSSVVCPAEGFIHVCNSIRSLGSAFRFISQDYGSNATWPVANKALFFPFSIPSPQKVRSVYWTLGTASGNIDAGIYDVAGRKIVSTGSTALSGVNNSQYVSLTATDLSAGFYYLALAVDNTTATFYRDTIGSNLLRVLGMQEMASAFPLPATATFANPVAAYTPRCGVSFVPTQ